MTKSIKGSAKPLKYDEPLDKVFQLRVTEKQKRIMRAAGSSDYWRDFILEHANEILQLEAVSNRESYSLDFESNAGAADVQRNNEP